MGQAGHLLVRRNDAEHTPTQHTSWGISILGRSQSGNSSLGGFFVVVVVFILGGSLHGFIHSGWAIMWVSSLSVGHCVGFFILGG